MKTEMSTTTLHLTKEDKKQLEYLKEELRETQSAIIRRAISILYSQIYFRETEKNVDSITL